MNEKKIIGITMGDPAGIGAEISVKLFADPSLYQKCRPLLIGDAAVIEQAIRIIGAPLSVRTVQDVRDARFSFGFIDVLHIPCVDITQFSFGEVSAMCGDAAFQYVKTAIELAMEKKIDATVTNALNKEALNLAGHHFSGHTEIYAHFTGTSKYTMMLAHENLRVVHVSTHVSLREACDRVTTDRVLEVIRIADSACKTFGISSPKIGVAGLNPHCGENGLFGREEIEQIAPAVTQAQKEGIRAEGPIPPDTVFSKARGGWYDIVVAMYHDQGHIPLKVVGFVYDQTAGRWNSVAGVNITIGLPIIRTSVDHGTAFDQAGTGEANELSLKNAVDYAITLAEHKE